MPSREASHAGSWYPRNEKSLRAQLEAFVDSTDASQHNIPGCRIIISPHAGYSYSGPTAAYGFKAIDWSGIRRVFILGPSHHHYMRGCALTQCTEYKTPFGVLQIDEALNQELSSTELYETMDLSVDEDEHSIEMQLPFLRMVMPADSIIPIVPILVGNLDLNAEREYGRALAKYLSDPANAFVISSDFCHWGSRFSYTYYHSPPRPTCKHVQRNQIQSSTPIWKSIEGVDHEGMHLIELGQLDDFAGYLQRTRNTICGRHPIGVIMAAIEECRIPGHFSFLDYRQSSKVTSPNDSSVSYASGVYKVKINKGQVS